MFAKLHHRLAVADDRDAWFEVIRDPNDPLLKDRRAPSQALCANDFLSQCIMEDTHKLSEMRLYATKQRIKAYQQNQEKKVRKINTKDQFIQKLWG